MYSSAVCGGRGQLVRYINNEGTDELGVPDAKGIGWSLALGHVTSLRAVCSGTRLLCSIYGGCMKEVCGSVYGESWLLMNDVVDQYTVFYHIPDKIVY